MPLTGRDCRVIFVDGTDGIFRVALDADGRLELVDARTGEPVDKPMPRIARIDIGTMAP